MKLAKHATPHLWGRLDYSALNRRMPYGDTIHLNHPMIFRRVVEAGQLRGFELRKALRKYDVFHTDTGDIFLVTGTTAFPSRRACGRRIVREEDAMNIAIKVVPAEERALAEMIADEIVQGWEADLPSPLIERFREKVIHDVLWIACGREHLTKVRDSALS